MSIRLSHSSQEKYAECSEKWRLHYQEKLRSIYLNSPLFFGTALDDAFSRILLEKKKVHTKDEQKMLLKTEQEIFKSAFENTYHNGQTVHIPTLKEATYSNKDYDNSVLESDDILAITAQAKILGLGVDKSNYEDFIATCRLEFKREGVDPDEQVLYNFIHWTSLYRKGLYLLTAYRQDVLPKIKEVFNIQEKVSLKDGDDEFIGYIDFEASFIDEPDVIYTCDNKTSSKAYPEDSVRTKHQLCYYTEFKGTNKGCYVVVEKELRKKMPRHRIQIIKDTIPEETYDQAFANVENVYQSIKQNKFEKLENSKNCFAFGKKCVYYKYCWEDKSMTGLVDMKKENND